MPTVQIGPHRAGPADAVTTVRLALAIVVAALVVGSWSGSAPVTALVAVATVALVLDAVDGQVARRTGTASRFGGRYDMEVDAFLVLALSVHVATTVAWWALVIGVARYLLLVAGWCWPWLRGETPPRHWAKVVAAVQGIVLTVVTAGLLPSWADRLLLAAALLLLAESFGHQGRQLWRRRADAPVMSPRERRVRAAAGTATAYVVLWLALVLPDRARDLDAGAFARLPLELVALLGLALVLPVRARRVLATGFGLVLAVVVVLKALDLGFTTVLDRPFDLLNDSYYLGPAIGVLRDQSGALAAGLAVGGAVVLLLTLLTLLPLAAGRAAAVAARHRRRTVPVLVALAGWGLVSLASGGGLTTAASSAVAVDEVGSLRADVADRRAFARALAADDAPDPGTGRLLSGLRGKDVLLVFVESYGRVAVQGSSFSPGVEAVLDRGSARLRAAGVGARSAFLTSPTFGAASWLAHSTLQSGLWVDSQQRYDQLVTARRTTLTSSFRRAGWRTVFDIPSNTKDWADGRRFYGFDQLYDARNVGYRGPKFGYAQMPDQFTLAAFAHRELDPGHRPPVMAEIDLVSSHHPWTPLPRQVPWEDVGDGSVFDGMPEQGPTSAEVLGDTDRVRAAYGASVEYTMDTLVSFVARRADPNLVLVVLGDHQPHSYVTGPDPGHDVPVSVLARDPRVLASIDRWGWQDGLHPAPDAPVWPMDAFRDRFLTAYSEPALEGSTP